MNKSTKIVLIVATALLASGMVLTFTAYAVAGFDYRKFSTAPQYTPMNYQANDGDYREIAVNGVSQDIAVVRGTGDTVEVEYYENKQQTYSIDDKDGSLIITEHHDYMFMPFGFNIDFSDSHLTLKVPASFKGSLKLSNSGGSVSTYDVSGIESLYVDTASGGVLIDNTSVAIICEVKTISGLIQFTESSADSVKLTTASGDILGTSSTDIDRFEVETLSGIIDLLDMSGKAMKVKTTSGRVGFSHLSGDSIAAESASGRIDADFVTVNDFAITTASGDISAYLVGSNEQYRIVTSSTSGRINAPAGNVGADKSISIETLSGSIDVDFDKRLD